MRRAQLSMAIAAGLTLVLPDLPRTVAQTAPSIAATQAYLQPSDELPKNSPIRQWFIDLADGDPKVREQAKFNLMGISRDDLPRLRQLVLENEPLWPAQADALHDIVLQAYLAGETYATVAGKESGPDGGDGPFFLGLHWDMEVTGDLRMGVCVTGRLPGFPGFRFLQPGDMIMGIYDDPKAPLDQYPNLETPQREILIHAISTKPSTQEIVLQVLRNGEEMQIPLKMAPRPLFADPVNMGALAAFQSARDQRADLYWSENYLPLLAADSPPDTSNPRQGT